MKKIVFCLLALISFAACDNSEPTAKDNKQRAEVQEDSSETQLPGAEKTEEIESFLERFFTTVFWEKDLKEMVVEGDQQLKSFEYTAFPLQVLWSMGAYCKSYEKPYEGVLELTTDTKEMPAKPAYSYKNEAPFQELSVCELDEIGWEGAPEPAIYYYKAEAMPTVPDANFENFVPVNGAEALEGKQLYRVTYWGGSLENYFDFYFVKADGKFYWVMWNLCNCEA